MKIAFERPKTPIFPFMDRGGWVFFTPYRLRGLFFWLFRPGRSEAPGSVALGTMVVKHEVLGVS